MIENDIIELIRDVLVTGLIGLTLVQLMYQFRKYRLGVKT